MNKERLIEWKDDDGEEYFVEEGAVAALLDAGVCYVSGCDHKCTIFVGFNDVFYWASADGEDLYLAEIPHFYRAWKADPTWGVVKWAAQKRKMRPQWPMAKHMIAAGVWDATMDTLPLRTDGGDHGWNLPEAQEWLSKRATESPASSE